jgi:DNA-binding transcriptional regulator YiaG
MTPKQLRTVLRRLGFSQLEAARRLGVHARTVRFWVAGTYRIPEPVVILLRTWLGQQQH